MIMSTVHLPEELIDRLAAEAARRGMTVDELAAETLDARFPPLPSQQGLKPVGTKRHLSFAGIGSSGPAGGDIARRHKEIIARSSPRLSPTRPPPTSESGW
jgi:hypothetical protein